jgi:hypothetical protein
MTLEQLERERREESLRRCRENEKAAKVRMPEEEPAEQQEVEGYPV